MILGEVKLWCIKDNLRKGAKAFGAETVRDLLDTVEYCEMLIRNLERNIALLEKRLASFGVSKHHVNGPLAHPWIPFTITRLALALRAVVEATGEAGERALETHCAERQEQDAREDV